MVMKLKLVSIIVVILMLFILSVNSASAQIPSYITITTGGMGGTWFPLGSAIADLLNRVLDGWPATATPGAGAENPKIVSTGEAEIGFSYSTTLLQIEEEGFDNLRGVCTLTDTMLKMAIAADRYPDVEYFDRDIINEQVGIDWLPSAPGTGDAWMIEKLMEELDFTYDDIRAWGGSTNRGVHSEAVPLWRDRHIDLAIFGAALNFPQPAFVEMNQARPMRILSLSEEVAKSVEKHGLKTVTMKAGVYEGQDYEVRAISMPEVLFVREDLSEELVYTLTKQIVENQELLTNVHSLFKVWDPYNAWEGTGVPLHPGAERYYKEAGYMP
jgi:uncharacterized protein